MSLFSGRDKKSQFYVEFLGWMECRGLRGQKYTDPVIRELRRRQKRMDKPPKLTIQVSKKDLKISQDVEVDKKGRNIRKIKFPTIPARDVTYVVQATRSSDGRLDDIVACIYLGYMPRTQKFVHVHVYRFDEATTAATFVRQMSAVVEANKDHIRETEIDLANRGEVDDPRLTSSDGMSEPLTTDSAMGSASSAYSDEESPTFGSDDIDPDLQSLHEVTAFDNVADELKFRLQMGDKPLLLPPKDYDTISRAHGNLENINRRRCLNLHIVGEAAAKEVQTRERNESSESGIDLASPQSDIADGSKVPSMESGSNVSPPSQRRSPVYSMQNPQPFPDFAEPSAKLTGSLGTSSRSISPEIPNDIYPPKQPHRSPPMSPKIGAVYPGRVGVPGPRGAHLSRQGSHTSRNSQDSDIIENGGPHYYRSGPNNDIYAMPAKKVPIQNGYGSSHSSAKTSPREEVPPADYMDEEDDIVQLRGAGPRFRQVNLTRSLPADLIRSEMSISGSYSPRTSGEIRPMGRVDSPTFVGGGVAPQHFGKPRVNSADVRRLNSSRR